MAHIRIGLSGYSYPEWQGEGLFYPLGLAKTKYLAHYATRYRTVEGVGTFRRMPAESSTEKILKQCPPDFQLSPKMHQRVTHFARLQPETYPVVDDFLKPLLPLVRADKLGPVLVQLPPNFAFDLDVLDTFLANVASNNDVRWAVEFRNPAWQTEATEKVLRRYGVGWVAEDTDQHDTELRSTADFQYVRLRKLDYSEAQLQAWADKLQSLNKDCYVYVRHLDVEAPWRWADRLIELVG